MPTARLKEHELKCWPKYFCSHRTGHKTFEIRRRDDRDFLVGDVLVLKEFDPCIFCGGAGRVGTNDARARCVCLDTDHPKGRYTGRSIRRIITYITDFGQPEGQVVMAVRKPEVPAPRFVAP